MKTGTCLCCAFAAIAAFSLAGTARADAESGGASKSSAEEAATLEKLRQTRDALSTVTEYKAALHPAEQIVAELEGRDIDMSADLLRLASIQASLKEYDDAETSYLHAIEVLEKRKGQYSPTLIGPYQALGRMYNDAGRFNDALPVLDRARWLSKRNHGLFNVEQSSVIDDMTTARLALGDLEKAEALQRERLDNAIRQFGPGAPELVPFYEHRAGYYEDTGSLVYARDELEKALEISKAHTGEGSPQSLELLRRLAALQLQINRKPYARDHLRDALAKAANVAPKERGLSLAVLGDWALVEGDEASAKRYYSEAYRALEEASDVDADEFFAKPTMLDFVPPLDFYAPQRPGRWSWGTAEFVFDVSASGQASDVRMVSAEPGDGDGIERDYARRILATHFRPALYEGRPVDSSGVSETYRYRRYAH